MLRRRLAGGLALLALLVIGCGSGNQSNNQQTESQPRAATLHHTSPAHALHARRPASEVVNSKHTLAPTEAPATVGRLQYFDTQDAAQAHCPNDTVVWLNTNSGIYHMQGERWYGNTREGAYVCQQEADAAGDRETRNGQ